MYEIFVSIMIFKDYIQITQTFEYISYSVVVLLTFLYQKIKYIFIIHQS
jgi:hypothetical protein